MKKKSKSSRIVRQQTKWGYFFIAPSLIGMALFSVGPMAYSFIVSLTEWNFVSPMKFIGLQNYAELFHDRLFYLSMKATIYYSLLTVPTTLVITFAIALLLSAKIKGMSIYRTIIYIPSVIPIVAGSAIWMYLYNPLYGLFDTILRKIGLAPVDFLFDRKTVIPSLVFMAVWGAGNTVVIYLAGLKNISTELMEAAEVDGANGWQKLCRIKIPMMTPIIFYNLIMGVINCMQTFTQVYIMTDGGPDNTSLFYALMLYRTAFKNNEIGYASAMSWILFVLIGILTLVFFKTSGKWVYYESEDE